MAEVMPTKTRLSKTSVLLEWAATTGTYYLWRDGWLEGSTDQLSWMIDLAPGEPAVVQVFDDAADRPAKAYPARHYLRWDRAEGAAKYRIDLDVDSAWVAQVEIPEDGRTHYWWRSGILADATSYTWRVTAVGANGVDGRSVEHTVMCVRHPDPPTVTWAIDEETGVVTVS